MTQAEQEEMGQRMGLPMGKWLLLEKKPKLFLPNTPMCAAWCQWAKSEGTLLRAAGFALIHPNNYNELGINWHSAAEQEESVATTGMPLVNWQFICSLRET